MRYWRLWQRPDAALPFLPPAVPVRRAQSVCVCNPSCAGSPQILGDISLEVWVLGSLWWPYSAIQWTFRTVLHAPSGRTGDLKVAALFAAPLSWRAEGLVDGF